MDESIKLKYFRTDVSYPYITDIIESNLGRDITEYMPNARKSLPALLKHYEQNTLFDKN